jgi:hypothetical protein
MRALLVCVVLASTAALAANEECSRSCDEVLKPMIAECRGGAKGGKKHADEDSGAAARVCAARLSKVRSACLQDCQKSNMKRR